MYLLSITLSNLFQEFANGKAAKDMFEHHRVQYDASYQKLQSLKKSMRAYKTNTKPHNTSVYEYNQTHKHT